MARVPVVGTIGIDTISRYVGLIGGVLGLLATVGGAAIWVIAYFATRNQLVIVDCHHYYVQESLSYQTTQLRVLSNLLAMDNKVATAELASKEAPQNVSLRTEFQRLKRDQEAALDEFKTAQQKSKEAIAEKDKCGYKGPRQL